MLRLVLALSVVVLGGCPGSDPLPEPTIGAVGATCGEDADCLSGLECFTGPEGARAWPDGYCTRPCERDVDCPGAAKCGAAWFGDGPDIESSRCLTECDRIAGDRGGCREGYACNFDGVCMVGCTNDAECVTLDYDPRPIPDDPSRTCEVSTGRCIRGQTPTAASLDSCASDADCRPPSGSCIGGINMCLNGGCDLGGDYACVGDEQCVGIGTRFDLIASTCLLPCTPGVDGANGENPTDACPAGFACLPSEADLLDNASPGFCFIPSANTFAGNPSAQVGDPCTTAADCPNPFGYGQCINGGCLTLYCGAPSLSELGLCTGPNEICAASDDARVEDIGRGAARLVSLGACLRRCASADDCPVGTCSEDGICVL